MKFYPTWRVYNTRYFAGATSFLIAIIVMIITPIILGKGFIFFNTFKIFFLSNFKLTGVMATLFLLVQVNGYYGARYSTKLLEILGNKVIFHLFNGKSITLNYSDIFCLNYTQDIFKNFQFTLKNGEVKVVYATVKNKEKAFEIIREKIKEFQKFK